MQLNLVITRKDYNTSIFPLYSIYRYRYNLDELPPILHKLKVRAEAFDAWGDKVKAVLVAKDKKLTLKEIKVLMFIF